MVFDRHIELEQASVNWYGYVLHVSISHFDLDLRGLFYTGRSETRIFKIFQLHDFGLCNNRAMKSTNYLAAIPFA